MSQDESDFSSFNLNSASIGASTKILKKDGYGLSFYLCRINENFLKSDIIDVYVTTMSIFSCRKPSR